MRRRRPACARLTRKARRREREREREEEEKKASLRAPRELIGPFALVPGVSLANVSQKAPPKKTESIFERENKQLGEGGLDRLFELGRHESERVRDLCVVDRDDVAWIQEAVGERPPVCVCSLPFRDHAREREREDDSENSREFGPEEQRGHGVGDCFQRRPSSQLVRVEDAALAAFEGLAQPLAPPDVDAFP